MRCRVFAAAAALAAAFVSCTAARGQEAGAAAAEAPYVPTPENLAAREAFRDAQFGVFIHWGMYSVPARGEWVMEKEKIPIAKYEPMAAQFDPEKFNADEWAQLFKRAGAKYVTITAKHHDGFCMWDSQQTDWDIVDRTPYGKDVLKQLSEACRKHGLKLFFYYSQVDWHHPEYYPRAHTGHSTGRPESGDFNKYVDYMNAQLSELLGGDYGPIAGIWFDGWWDQQKKRRPEFKDAPPHETLLDWRLRETYDLIHRLQPAALVGANHHVAPFPGEDFQMFERDLPGENKGGHSRDAVVGKLPLETCDTLNRSWGYNAGDHNFKTVKQCVHYLVRAAGRDANLLLNIGPRPDGTIDPESAKRLEGIGAWLAKYEATVRPTRGGPVLPQSWGATTEADDAVYIHVLDSSQAGADGWLELAGSDAIEGDALTCVGEDAPVDWQRGDGGVIRVKRAWDPETIDVVFRVAK
jgi:alpha-L-fucosidase